MVVAELASIGFAEIPEAPIRVPDKITALDKLGRHLGMFVQRTEHTGAHGGPITFIEANEAKERLAQKLAAIADRIMDALTPKESLAMARLPETEHPPQPIWLPPCRSRTRTGLRVMAREFFEAVTALVA